MSKTSYELSFGEYFGVDIQPNLLENHIVTTVTDKKKFKTLIRILSENDENHINSANIYLDNGNSKAETINMLVKLAIGVVKSTVMHYVIDINRPFFIVEMRKNKLECLIKKSKK